MRVRALDSSGDIFSSGAIFLSDKEAVAQTISTRLKLFLGEYFRDVTDGMPWFERQNGLPGILQKGFTIAQVEGLIRDRIMKTDGVLKILTFSTSYDIDKRAYNVETTVFTEFGEVSVSYGTAD